MGAVRALDYSTRKTALTLDIFPTGHFGADLAHIHPGHTVSVFGCGPVGQFAIISALLMQIVSAGSVQPERIITQEQPMRSAIDAYRMLAEKKAGWMKVELRP